MKTIASFLKFFAAIMVVVLVFQFSTDWIGKLFGEADGTEVRRLIGYALTCWVLGSAANRLVVLIERGRRKEAK